MIRKYVIVVADASEGVTKEIQKNIETRMKTGREREERLRVREREILKKTATMTTKKTTDHDDDNDKDDAHEDNGFRAETGECQCTLCLPQTHFLFNVENEETGVNVSTAAHKHWQAYAR
eukprot:m.44589 g.44589  ORF g.44589 m.44589 type:complete len:120 (+) comp19710_c0_seq2:329-688(+)